MTEIMKVTKHFPALGEWLAYFSAEWADDPHAVKKSPAHVIAGPEQ